MSYTETQNIAYSTDTNLPGVIYYLQTKYPTSDDNIIQLFDYWGVRDTYDNIWEEEKFMRANIYNPVYSDHLMNTDMYYKLRSMNIFSDIFNRNIGGYHKPDDLLFASARRLQVLEYSLVQERLSNLNFLFDIAHSYGLNVALCGEYVFAILTGINGDVSVLPRQTIQKHISVDIGAYKSEADVYFY